MVDISSMTPEQKSPAPVLARPTLRDVASEASVSTATVARVLRDDAKVAADTRRRVQEVLDRTGYTVNTLARELRTQKASTIGLIANGIAGNAFYASIASGVQEAAVAVKRNVLIYNSLRDADRERRGVEEFLSRRVEAIVFATPASARNVQLAVSSGCRVVQVERPTAIPTAMVTADNKMGAREATEFLIGLGHRRIVFIGRRPLPDVARLAAVEGQRLDGYKEAMLAAGGRPDILYYENEGGKYEESFLGIGRHLMDSVLARADALPTAVFAASDLFAAGVLQSLYLARISVPDDVSVVGFDDISAAQMSPPLASVRLPAREMGAAALNCIVGPDPFLHVHLETRLVLRGSTGPPRSRT